MKRVSVGASSRYDVLIKRGCLKDAGEQIAALSPICRAAVITDDAVDALYGDAVMASLERAGITACKYAFLNGEASKTIQTFSNILEFLAQNHMTRSDVLIALGGGVVGDITGFCAASYLRGVEFFQLPTTFLAAIDSSVGGKTGVNLSAGKNLAGAFCQPKLVLCDPDTFYTLPKDVFADGIAEAIKYGVIADHSLFDLLAQGEISSRLDEIVERCVGIKSRIVETDEFDRGERQLLNFGHSIGHAIEKCSGYTVTHGHAVGIGMALMARAAWLSGLSCVDCAAPIEAALLRHGLPVTTDIPFARILDAMRSDKKCQGDMITLVLPEHIGVCRLKTLSIPSLVTFLRPAFEKEI